MKKPKRRAQSGELGSWLMASALSGNILISTRGMERKSGIVPAGPLVLS